MSLNELNLEEKLELSAQDNERLYKENSKLRKSVEYYKWRFREVRKGRAITGFTLLHWSTGKSVLQFIFQVILYKYLLITFFIIK